MKTLLAIIVSTGLLSLTVGVFNCAADLEVSAGVQIHAQAEFYEPLASHGTWVEVGSYGRCWRPGHVAVEWRPYGYGSWVWTDCGWYWVSDEPWGWACYHYGNWVYDPAYAWVWVPGIEWAPSWVSWRVGGGYVGWAPLPPRGVVVAAAGVALSPFVFVEVNRFHQPVRPSTLIVNNTTIINKTTQINNIRSETKSIAGAGPRKVMVNEGPGLATVQKADKQVRVVSIHEAVRQTSIPAGVTRRTGEQRNKDDAVGSPDRGNQSSHEEFSRSPERPPGAQPPPAGSDRPSRERGGGRGHEGHGKDKP